ncbi:MAG: hypothetical protein ACUVRG_12060, partial [Ignavibacterium sp.]|uniref:hypothetical protein n=1 Tax=Ignavibacterium sp. TaxID=2651167 RepID=UPI00404B3EBD
GGEEIVGYGTVVIKKDECEEEIVVCENNQAQIFNPLWIEKYRNYSYFDYDLKDPFNPNYIVQGCQLKRNNLVQGITFIMPGMPIGKNWSQSYSWTPQDNATIKVCLLENENRWLIKFDELRIPIFSSACIQDYVDLGNGLEISLLDSYVKNINEYKKVINDIDKWRNDYPVPKPERYAFSSGIIKHEYRHFLIDSLYVITVFNNLFNTFFNDQNWFLDKNTYSCPESVLSTKKFLLRDEIQKALNNCFLRYSNLSSAEKETEELDCVKFAQDEYDLIKKRIQQWAVNQPWFKP